MSHSTSVSSASFSPADTSDPASVTITVQRRSASISEKMSAASARFLAWNAALRYVSITALPSKAVTSICSTGRASNRLFLCSCKTERSSLNFRAIPAPTPSNEAGRQSPKTLPACIHSTAARGELATPPHPRQPLP